VPPLSSRISFRHEQKKMVWEAGERSGGLGSPAWAGKGFYNSYEVCQELLMTKIL
jgi:hypothetical protein